MRQEVSRAHKGWALDTVTLHNEVTQLVKESAKDPPKVGLNNICFLKASIIFTIFLSRLFIIMFIFFIKY